MQALLSLTRPSSRTVPSTMAIHACLEDGGAVGKGFLRSFDHLLDNMHNALTAGLPHSVHLDVIQHSCARISDSGPARLARIGERIPQNMHVQTCAISIFDLSTLIGPFHPTPRAKLCPKTAGRPDRAF
jgi:hypothetical protein